MSSLPTTMRWCRLRVDEVFGLRSFCLIMQRQDTERERLWSAIQHSRFVSPERWKTTIAWQKCTCREIWQVLQWFLECDGGDRQSVSVLGKDGKVCWGWKVRMPRILNFVIKSLLLYWELFRILLKLQTLSEENCIIFYIFFFYILYQTCFNSILCLWVFGYFLLRIPLVTWITNHNLSLGLRTPWRNHRKDM